MRLQHRIQVRLLSGFSRSDETAKALEERRVDSTLREFCARLLIEYIHVSGLVFIARLPLHVYICRTCSTIDVLQLTSTV